MRATSRLKRPELRQSLIVDKRLQLEAEFVLPWRGKNATIESGKHSQDLISELSRQAALVPQGVNWEYSVSFEG